MNLFFNLDPKQFTDTKFNVEDVGDMKSHYNTPTQFVVRGPRKLLYAKELIDLYMEENGGVKSKNYVEKDFTVKNNDREKLLKEGLIKANTISRQYENIIYSNDK